MYWKYIISEQFFIKTCGYPECWRKCGEKRKKNTRLEQPGIERLNGNLGLYRF